MCREFDSAASTCASCPFGRVYVGADVRGLPVPQCVHSVSSARGAVARHDLLLRCVCLDRSDKRGARAPWELHLIHSLYVVCVVCVLCVGGSWDEGAASFLIYDADTDISLVEDVIVVTVNYRLNVFGFLASTALRNQVCVVTCGSRCTHTHSVSEL